MRIQHNITAMNSYRNFSANNSKLGKNLEKLSSGYAINRAGDDAAGLAISEKMRVQISGLEGAKKNAKDGISLIQTAEGALTETHDMLNRMVVLAEQSANGTYQNELDREQLQKEIQSLKSEIDRIADSTNFNGLKLLDGSLSTEGTTAAGGATEIDVSGMGVDILSNVEDISAVKGKYTTSALISTANSSIATGDKYTMTLNYTDSDGNEQSLDVTLKAVSTVANNGGKAFVLDDGSEDGIALNKTVATGGTVTATELSGAFQEALSKIDELKPLFSFSEPTSADGTLIAEARTAGTSGAVLNSFTLSYTDISTPTNNATYATKVDVATKPQDATQGYNLTKATIWDGEEDTLDDAIFEVNGQKFVFVANGTTLSDDQNAWLSEAGVGNNYVTASAATLAATDVQTMVPKIASATGLVAKQGTITNGVFAESTSGTFVKFTLADAVAKKVATGGLTLQIGDTSDEFNRLTVSVGDMHSEALGLGKLDISTQEGATKAIDLIKSAVNQVSDTRGTLGALQNRLDHTINNIGVMTENIQSAESNIRDTDVAEEMMKYTKNNILNQSAQAMLAQANQLPQGVLQLLQ